MGRLGLEFFLSLRSARLEDLLLIHAVSSHPGLPNPQEKISLVMGHCKLQALHHQEKLPEPSFTSPSLAAGVKNKN